jgi:hypothetical protein
VKAKVHDPMNALACDASSCDCAEPELGSASAARSASVVRIGVVSLVMFIACVLQVARRRPPRT